jgi:PadR family transcriptional regulator AphA
MPRASTTTHALLSLIALRPGWSTYELTGQVTRALRFLLPRAESRIYNEARALAERGLVRATDVGNGLRPRTVYELTPAGHAELERWLAGPVSATRLESEALLRVLVGRLASRRQLLDAVQHVRGDAEGIAAQGQAVAAEYLQGVAPFQDDIAYRALVFDFLFHYSRMLRDWADRAEATIETWGPVMDAPTREAAMARIRELAGELPSDPGLSVHEVPEGGRRLRAR